MRLALLAAWLCVALAAEIVDRIAVTIANQVITEAQIMEEIRVTAFLNREQPDYGVDQKRQAAERLIEQTLLRRDMEFSHYPATDPAEADTLEAEVRTQYTTAQELEAALAKYGIDQRQLHDHLLWQVTMLRFIEYRFKPSIQVPEAEIREYYEAKRADWQKRNEAKIPTLAEARAEIETILTQQRVDQAVDRWIGDARTRVEIQFHKGVFE